MEQAVTIDFSGVPIQVIRDIEGSLIPLIERALMYSEGEYTAADIIDYAMHGKMQLWVAATTDTIKGCVVTELVNYKRIKVCQIVLTAGVDFDQWKYGYDLIEQWARLQGADKMLFYGRPGWEKVMKPQGFHKAYTVMTKELRDDAHLH